MTISYKRLGVRYTVAQSAVAVPLTGDTSETTLATIIVPGGAMGPSGRVIVDAEFSCTASTNAKTARVKFGGTTYTINAVSTGSSISFNQITSVRNISVSSQIGKSTGNVTYGASSGASITSSVDTSSDVTILITGQLASGAETMTLVGYSVEVVYGA